MKDNLYQNGKLNKRQLGVIPKGQKLHYIKELRLYILVDKELSQADIKAKERRFVERYMESQVRMFGNMLYQL